MTPSQKDDMMRWLVPALLGIICGSGAGFGSSRLSAGEVTVSIKEPVKAELPPSQIELLKDASALGEQVSSLTNRMDEFFRQYVEDQREFRITNDAIRAALAEHTSQIGVLQVKVGGTIESVNELRQENKAIDRRVQDMERRSGPGVVP